MAIQVESDMVTPFAPSRFLAALFRAFVAARERQAASYLNGALLMLDDQTLRDFGYERAVLEKHSVALPML